jgi:hypothetical protein
MKAAVNKRLESCFIVAGDRRKSNMYLVLVVLSADVKRWAYYWQRSEPLLASDVRHVFHQLNNALARAPLTREQTGLIKWHPVFD